VIKVKKIYLRRGFTPIDKHIFIEGKATSFDCYIQRFNGFALWIIKGTVIDAKLMHSIQKNSAQLFIDNKEIKTYHNLIRQIGRVKSIESEPIKLDEAIEDARTLEKSLIAISTHTAQLESIYNVSKSLINAWSLHHTRPLPLDAFYKIAQTLVACNKSKAIAFSNFNSFLDESYSLSAHMSKVAFFASIIGAKLRLDPTDQEKLVLAGLIHDTGKTEVNEDLIEKPEKLTPDEFKTIQSHVSESVIAAKQCGLRDRAILDGIGEHHERLDGSGYPNGLVAGEISQFGKILGVCDVFDALITIKPYRGAYSTFNALMLMREEYNHKLDGRYIRLLISALQ
jgi:HD-GYP domain-containing protein (c-di-GMP phosphodiesterase class II)